MIFVDKFQKKIELTDEEIRIKRPDDKHGHGYSRTLPYSSVERIVFQKGSFFNYGFFSLVTIAGGVTYNKCNLNPGELGSAVDDETTFMFEKKDAPEIEKLIAYINGHRSNTGEKPNTLSEFWGMTYKEGKNSIATLLPEGIKYNRNGNQYTLPYAEILKAEFEPQNFDMVIMRKGLDSKIRLQQYKKAHTLSDDDKRYSLNVYQVDNLWARHFYKALSIIMDNRHLIPYSNFNSSQSQSSSFDQMSGYEFENFCAEILRKNGFDNIDVTPKSGDQGVDILAMKDGVKYAIQCKCYSSNVGNTSVQEVHAGKNFYNCHVGVVMTNAEFTPSAISLAAATGVLLWDRWKIKEMM